MPLRVVPAGPALLRHVDEVGLADDAVDARVAAAPRQERPVEAAEHVDVLAAPAADRPDGVRRVGVEHRGEAGQAPLDDLLEHDVGQVEADLRAVGALDVVELDGQRRAIRRAT